LARNLKPCFWLTIRLWLSSDFTDLSSGNFDCPKTTAGYTIVLRTLLKVGELLKFRKWIYLLTGLMYPTKRAHSGIRPDSCDIPAESVAEIDLSRIGIRLKGVFLTKELRGRMIKVDYEHECENRFAFYINDGEEDDTLAQRFADATMLALAVAYDVAPEETPTAIRIPESCVKKGRIVRIKDVVGDEGYHGKSVLDERSWFLQGKRYASMGG
jgi:hypothetical protein